ncbi:UNVERIFIED_CONTAM: hypothetical protein Sradi_5747800 [Sesamum radiatum]|uniref:Uncharacterized protein n=1 Tax=Sesamum radiatum TaxID=300843 RepID=A0AAW2L2H9_SESRA
MEQRQGSVGGAAARQRARNNGEYCLETPNGGAVARRHPHGSGATVSQWWSSGTVEELQGGGGVVVDAGRRMPDGELN